MRSPRKRQGSTPQRGRAKKTLTSLYNTDDGSDGDISGDTSGSSANTILLESNDDISEDNPSAGVCLKWGEKCAVIVLVSVHENL